MKLAKDATATRLARIVGADEDQPCWPRWRHEDEGAEIECTIGEYRVELELTVSPEVAERVLRALGTSPDPKS